MLRRIKRLLLIINGKSLLITILALVSTFLCMHFDFVAKFPLTVLSTAVVFPIVFSIGGAYKRREVVLDRYGSIKAHGRAIFFASRDWLEGSDAETLAGAKEAMEDLKT